MRFGNSQFGFGRGHLFILLALLFMAAPLSAATIVSTVPAQNALNVPVSANISVTFDEDMNETTLNNSTILIHSNMTGLHPSVITYDAPSRTVTINPDRDFMAGEVVSVMLTTGIENSGGIPLSNAFGWSFTVDVDDGDGGDFAHGGIYNTTLYTKAVHAADFDGDGDLDVAAASSDKGIYILTNMGGREFEITALLPQKADDIYAGDFDGDLDIDLAWAYSYSKEVGVYVNDGSGQFAPSSPTSVKYSLQSLDAADFDGDGDLDIAINHHNNDSITVLFNDGGGVFFGNALYAVAYSPFDVWAADLNKDGYADLAVAPRDAQGLSVLLNRGDGTFGPEVKYNTGQKPDAIIAADLNSDGHLDLISANPKSSAVSVLLNYGDGTFHLYGNFAVTGGPVSVAAADVDNDGDLDLVTADQEKKSVSFLFNRGDGYFNRVDTLWMGNKPYSIFPADLDNDTDVDFVTSTQNTVSFIIKGLCWDPDNDGWGDPDIPTNQCRVDNCPTISNVDQADIDADGLGDVCDDDKDGDGIDNALDNCPSVYNPDQADNDGNGVGDLCAIMGDGVYTDVVLSMDNSTKPDTLFIGGNYQFRVWIANTFYLGGFSLGFRVYSGDGVSWQWMARPDGRGAMQAVTVYPDSRLGYPDGWTMDMTKLLVTERDVDGLSPDTIMIGGVAMSVGMPIGPLEPQAGMHFSPVEMPGDLGTICIDSTFVPPSGAFVFVSPFVDPNPPIYEGPFCWPVARMPLLGDFDLDRQITVGHAVYMIAVIFRGAPIPVPSAAGDVNCDDSFNVGDAIYLINYIFKYGPAPGCP